MFKPSFKERAQRCFALSCKMVFDYEYEYSQIAEENSNCVTAYGRVKASGVSQPIYYPHAWVMEGDRVYDPAQDIEMTWKEYQNQFDAAIFRTFSRSDLVDLIEDNIDEETEEIVFWFKEIIKEYKAWLEEQHCCTC